MLKRILGGAVILSLLSPVIARAETADIRISGDKTYKSVRLTTFVYNKSNRDLSDILILNEMGEPEPYFINNFETSEKEKVNAKYTLDFKDSFVKDGDTYADYFIEADEQKDVLATSITVRTSSGMFAKTVELRGSYDGVTWDFIQTDKLYSVDDSKKLTITFTEPLKYTYYRYKILDNAEKVAFDEVYLEYSQNAVNQVFFTETTIPEFEAEEQEKDTVINIFGLKNVRINKMTFETDDQFKRPVYFAQGREKTLYNLSFGGVLYQDMTLDFGGFRESSDILKVTIKNGDDKPINIKNISVTYFTDEVIFKGVNGEKYTLSFGDESVLSAPVYDIVNYRDLILSEGYDILALENIKAVPVQREEPVPDYSRLFNIIIVLVSVLLGFIIIARLKRSDNTGHSK